MGLALAMGSAPDVSPKTRADPKTSGQTPRDLSVCKVGTSPGAALEAVSACRLMNSLETTMRGETTKEVLSSLSRQQMNCSAAQGHLEALTVAL